MEGSYRIEFPDLFRLWKEHDLGDHGPAFGSYRPEFYVGLRREDEPAVWRFIEENYLLKYRSLVRVDFDWMAYGLWEIPFPGSVSMGPALSAEYFGMPDRLAGRIQAWQANLDSREPVGDLVEEEFHYEASDAEGLEIAKAVKVFLGEVHYVEFHLFREIVVRDGAAVELEVPRFITDIAR